MADEQVTAALLVIGDEILSGRTKDKNIGTVADFCADLGIDLKEVRVIGDEMQVIVDAVNTLRSSYGYLFTTGGIGPTHDDITADAIARAFGVELVINDEARRVLEERYGTVDVAPERLRMARVPVGGTLILNSVSGAPGFTIGNVHVMAGVPQVMQAMLEDLSGKLRTGRKWVSETVPCGVGESVVSAGLRAIQEAYPALKIGSYPHIGDRKVYAQLVIRGVDPEMVKKAAEEVRVLVDRLQNRHSVTI
ncbi:MAG: competence/damage-inducible protein A [Hyphomicrobiaceae bacterium]|nr:competence/damage-inducible protein A [Hyphomicrobiaceae bacterium]